MDAQQYYIQGIAAVKNGDMVTGRKYLLQSLKLKKDNDQAWMWVSRTLADPAKKLQCADRALAINPHNKQALQLQQSLTQQPPDEAPQNNQHIRQLMREAETLVKTGRTSEAVDKWVMVLDIQYDHEEAMKKAVEYFMAQKMMPEIKTLIYNAVDHGTDNATILLSALDLAKDAGDNQRIDALYEKIAGTDWVGTKRLIKFADSYVKQDLFDNAIRILQNGLTAYPDDPAILTRIAEIHEETGREALAMQYYERVASGAVRSKLGKEADKRLSQSVPVLTDNERGSMWLAWREAFGVLLFFFLLAFQDAGLSLAGIGARWGGVLVALVGAYLFITGTSAPQQSPIARWLGGTVPDDKPKTPHRKLNPVASMLTSIGVPLDEESYYSGPIHEPTHLPMLPLVLRWLFGIAGCILLVFAFLMVVPTAIELVSLPEAKLDPQYYEALAELQSQRMIP